MADYRIGEARLDVPGFLPAGEVADPPESKSVSAQLKWRKHRLNVVQSCGSLRN